VRGLAQLMAVTAAGLVLAACGSSAADQVRAEVQQLAQATATRAYGTICARILAPSLVAKLRSLGAPCPDALRLALRDVHNPVVSVGKVVVRGSRAWAITLTSARGQRAELVAVQLSRTRQGWRITSLASPLSVVSRR
jgi:hypothetical protein